MQYILFLYGDEEAFHDKPHAEQERIVGEHMAFSQALSESGAMVSGNPLGRPSAGRIVRQRGGSQLVENGPFSDAKEQLGGYYIIEASDLDEALDWAAKCPAASDGAVEVRPIWSIE
ncbi:MAG: YciI family protein [Alphaproteobacteria bacterium]|nr:YciI family protein [Alphaproteobacteria bacterium]